MKQWLQGFFVCACMACSLLVGAWAWQNSAAQPSGQLEQPSREALRATEEALSNAEKWDSMVFESYRLLQEAKENHIRTYGIPARVRFGTTAEREAVGPPTPGMMWIDTEMVLRGPVPRRLICFANKERQWECFWMDPEGR